MINEWPEKENKEIVSERENITQALEKIKKTEIFNSKYLKDISLVVFSMGGNPIELFKNGQAEHVDGTDYNNQDFMQGKRVDFIGIRAKEDFIKIDQEKLNDKQILPFLFVEGKLSYEEFVAHEIAHNVFDREYKIKYGEFKDDNGVTNVSQEYLGIVANRLKKLIVRYYPNLDINKFNLQRQKIAEIFAMIYEREFCKRSNDNFSLHVNVKRKVKEFLSNPAKILAEFNKKYNRHCELRDMYRENHMLSLIIVPLLEEEYSNFEDRKNFLWKK